MSVEQIFYHDQLLDIENDFFSVPFSLFLLLNTYPFRSDIDSSIYKANKRVLLIAPFYTIVIILLMVALTYGVIY